MDKKFTTVTLPSGREGWQGRLQDQYESFMEFAEYALARGLVERLGFEKSIDAWEANPMVQGSIVPSDYRLVPESELGNQRRNTDAECGRCGMSEDRREGQSVCIRCEREQDKRRAFRANFGIRPLQIDLSQNMTAPVEAVVSVGPVGDTIPRSQQLTDKMREYLNDRHDWPFVAMLFPAFKREHGLDTQTASELVGDWLRELPDV